MDPRKKTGKVCRFWLEGRCRRPSSCRFLHAIDEPNTNKRPPPPPAKEFEDLPPSNKIRGDAAVCQSFLDNGTACALGDKCPHLHAWCSNNLSLVAHLRGHQRVIRGISLALGDCSNRLLSASGDGNVRMWECESGNCLTDINLGQQVGCLAGEGTWVFASIPNAIKAWNLKLETELILTGPCGQVYALATSPDYLFAGVQDGTIAVWKVDASTISFQPAGSLAGGHRSAVVSLAVGGTRLYSGSIDTTIKIWDITTLQCLQTLRDHKEVVTSLLCWDQFLLSCSLDRTIKVWAMTTTGKFQVTYTHNEEHGLLRLHGLQDMQGKSVLLCSCNDNTVKLFQLPSLSECGKIFSREEVRALEIGPSDLIFTGDGSGDLKVWKLNSC